MKSKVGTVSIALVLGVGLHSGVTLAQTKSGIDVFRADVILERTVIDQSGRVVRETPPVRLHLSRTELDGMQRTTMMIGREERDTLSGAARDPYDGMRVEFDDNGSPLRIFDKNGQPLSTTQQAIGVLPPADLRAAVLGRGLVLRDTVKDRHARLRRDLGAPKGQLRGLDRYLAQSGDLVQEVLVAPATAAPVEINVVRKGVLESHSTFAYDVLPDGTLVRHIWRDESRIPGEPSERLVMQVTLSNVVAGKER